MMTPTHWFYKVAALYRACLFTCLFMAEMVASLRDHNWNVWETIKDFVKEFQYVETKRKADECCL